MYYLAEFKLIQSFFELKAVFNQVCFIHLERVYLPPADVGLFKQHSW